MNTLNSESEFAGLWNVVKSVVAQTASLHMNSQQMEALHQSVAALIRGIHPLNLDHDLRHAVAHAMVKTALRKQRRELHPWKEPRQDILLSPLSTSSEDPELRLPRTP